MQVSTLILGTSCSRMPELFTPTSDSVCRHLVEHIQAAVSYGDAAGLLRLSTLFRTPYHLYLCTQFVHALSFFGCHRPPSCKRTANLKHAL